MVQIGVAVVHLDKPRQMALALGVATACIVIILTLIGLSVDPYSGILSVSTAPLERMLLR